MLNSTPRFIAACHREATDATPIWFMRQAGRYMPEYRALRERYSMLELCRTPELAAKVTLQPIAKIDVDAAILFADILLPLAPMGADFEFARGEGPVIHHPIRTVADADRLTLIEPRESLGYVLETLKIVRAELSPSKTLIGFAGAPFTLASYLIEGGKSTHFEKTKGFMYSEPEGFARLLSKLAKVTVSYLRAQVEAGAQALQLFDSWVGQLSVDDYNHFVAPHTKFVFDALKEQGVPMIHFGTGTASLLTSMRDAGGSVIGVDWREPIANAWDRLGPSVAVQGNLDPCTLFAPWPVVRAHAEKVLRSVNGRPGHIFNLGHGILPTTPVETVQRLTDWVHEETRRS